MNQPWFSYEYIEDTIRLHNNKVFSSITDLGSGIIVHMRTILSTSSTSISTLTSTSTSTSTSVNSGTSSNGVSFVVGLVVLLIFPLVMFFPMCCYAFRPWASSSPSTSTSSSSSPSPLSSKKPSYLNKILNGKLRSNQQQQQQRRREHMTITTAQSEEQLNNEHLQTNTNTSTSTSTSTTPQSIQGGFKNVLNEVSSMFEERSTQVRKILEDFSQPFVGFTRVDDFEDNHNGNGNGNGNGNDDDGVDSCSSHQLDTVVVEGCLGGKGEGGGERKDIGIETKTKRNNTMETNQNDMTHFCFLVHGYRGNPADLLYLRTAMAETAEQRFAQNETTSKENTTNETEKEEKNEEESSKHRIVLHSCRTNWNHTSDGVAAGGDRIFNEMLGVIRNSMENDVSDGVSTDGDFIVDVTVSLIGNSLGGLYARYALKRLAEFSIQQRKDDNDGSSNSNGNFNVEDASKTSFLIDGKIRVHFNIFCTTATPHLGVSGHTYLPLPRSAELGIGSLMGQTGRDIFRMSPLVKSMCTEESFLKPLSSFRKRIAYANGYHTDFVVSTKTAAFLHPDSTIPHRMSDRFLVSQNSNGTDDSTTLQKRKEDNGLVVATLYTQPSAEVGSSNSSTCSINDESTSTSTSTSTLASSTSALNKATNGKKKRLPKLLRSSSVRDDLLEMSSAMDQLGWKKVIVDLRNEMPMKLPMPKRRNILPRLLQFNSDNPESPNEIENNDRDKATPIEFSPTAPRKILESRDVDQAFSIPDDFIGFPLGHNTMVAVAQSRFTFVFKGGRPLMDKLAVEMIDEILSFDK